MDRTRFLLPALGVLVSVSLLLLAAFRLDWPEVGRALLQSDLMPWLPIAVASYLAGHIVRGMRLRLLLPDAGLRLVTASNVVAVGYGVNNILPARAGEFARAAIITNRTGLPYAEALTVIVVERLLDGLAILGLFFAGARFVVLPDGWIRSSQWIVLALFAAAACAVGFLTLFPELVRRQAARLSTRLPHQHQRRLLRLVAHVTGGVSALGRPRNALRIAALSVCIWLLEAGMFLALLPALGFPLAPAWAVVIMAVTNLGLFLPSTPGFIGPFHFFCMQAVVALGGAPASAFAYAVLVHLAFFVPITLWGVGALVAYGVEFATLRSLTRTARSVASGADETGELVRATAGAGVRIETLPRRVARSAGRSATLDAVVRAFLVSTGDTLARLAPPVRAQVTEDVAGFVDGQVRALPRRLRVLMAIGLKGFALLVRLRYPRGLGRLAPDEQVAVVFAWAFGRSAAVRSMFRLIRSTVFVAFYDHPAVTAVQPPVMPDTGKAADTMSSQAADVLIIGSGAGGASTALVLAEAGLRVLVLEEGRRVDLSEHGKGSTDAILRMYRNRGMTPILGRVPIGYVEGCCVGGSTEINSGFWHRTPAEMLLRWQARYDLAGIEAMDGHFEWAERLVEVGPHAGPWPPSTALMAQGAERMGWSVHEVPRAGAVHRSEHANQGMSRSVLPRAEAAGARILTGCRAKLLLRSGARVSGVLADLVEEDGRTAVVRLDGAHVFVCAGATETPALLRRSGIRRNVGNSLRLHPMLKVIAAFPDTIDSVRSVLPLVQVKEFGPEITLGGAFFTAGHAALVLSENWPGARGLMAQLPRLAAYYVAVRGTRAGTVRPSFWSDHTFLRHELGDEDLRNLSNGLARLSMLLLAAGAEAVYPGVFDLPPITEERAAVRWLDDGLPREALSLTTVHAFSSCPMGERDDRCAADSFGRVHGFDNLYINDSSMLPDSPGVNPQGSVMAFARRNALHFRDHRA